MGAHIYVHRRWSGKKLFCVVMSNKAESGSMKLRFDGEEYFAMALFSPPKDGEMAMVYSATAKRHKIS